MALRANSVTDKYAYTTSSDGNIFPGQGVIAQSVPVTPRTLFIEVSAKSKGIHDPACWPEKTAGQCGLNLRGSGGRGHHAMGGKGVSQGCGHHDGGERILIKRSAGETSLRNALWHR